MAISFPVPEPVTLPIQASADRFPVRSLYCIGRNYAAHAREMGKDPDREPPFFFMKQACDILQPGEPLTYPPGTSDLHHEIELVVALGAGGAFVSKEQASDLIWGYGVGLDMTRRDLQGAAKEKGRPWEIGKSFAGAAPMGALLPKSGIDDIASKKITLSVNDTLRQEGMIADMIWDIDEMIAHISQFYRFEPGDLIFTGTPAGVAAVGPGDVMVGAVEGVGSITVPVQAGP